ncbi:hypothetical protein HU200_048943 [Digitaria exilis]|uniref:Speckle-type POZ protein n=1 Tax=Digitaria exilis TaxID=1010633 RepID=A0A835AVX7_9POAL|nr:hypothetical protein HU200_048943 [Digitaria exilis]
MVGSNAAAHSMSTFSIKELHGSHVLTVNGYTKAKELAVGEFWRSAIFSVAGHRWIIKYYPNGDTPENAGYVSFYLRLVETNASDVKARFGFSLLDTRGKPVPSYCHDSSSINTFSLKGTRSNGWKRFIKTKNLEQHQPAFLSDDTFRVRCNITVFKEVNVDHTAAATTPAPSGPIRRLVEVPPPEMERHLCHLLSSGEGADVAFEVGGETVPAHRTILAARSPVFKAELFGPARPSGVVCVWVDGIEADAFKAMLHFVYTDSLPEVVEEDGAGGEAKKATTMMTEAMAQGLLAAADRYGLERLKLMCEDKLCDGIQTSSVGTLLALAEKHGCQGLKKACLDFLMSGSNLKAAIMSGGLEELTSSYPSVLNELLAKMAL